MRFPSPLIEGRLVQRYKRFLADVDLATGERVIAHCANPGAMLGLVAPGSRVLLSRSTNPLRKLAYSWELVEVALAGGAPQLVGVDTTRPNALVAEALTDGRLPPLTGYARVRREVKYGERSRVDFLLEDDARPPCFVEVKNCHLMREPGLAEFPDCVAARSARHMGELASMVAGGARAVLVWVIQMTAERFDVARDIDPAYDRAYRAALTAGVEAYAFTCRIAEDEVVIDGEVSIVTPAAELRVQAAARRPRAR